MFPLSLTIHPLILRGQVWVPDTNVIVAFVDSDRVGFGQVTVILPGMGDRVRKLFESTLELNGDSKPAWTAEAVDEVLRVRLRQQGMAAKSRD